VEGGVAVVGGAVVPVVAGAVVAGALVAVGSVVVDDGVASTAAGAVVSVVATFARRGVDVVVDTSTAIGTVDVVVSLVTEGSDRARPKRKAPNATVTTRTAMKTVTMAWSTALLPRDGGALTTGVSPVGSSQLAIGGRSTPAADELTGAEFVARRVRQTSSFHASSNT
jgi:hypothetical protein